MFTYRVATLIRITIIAAALAGFMPKASADPPAELDLLLLGDTDSPALVELMQRHRIHVAPAEDPQQALNKLNDVDALLVDVVGLDEASRPSADAIIELAHRTGVTVVAARASSTDMARWVGLGIESDLVVLGLSADGRTPKLEIIVPAGAMQRGDGTFPTEVRIEHTEEMIRSNAVARFLKTTGPQRINYKAWFLGGDILHWTPSGNPGGSNQQASVNISYQVELVANSELNQQPNARYLKIATLGTGMNPGNLPSTSSQDDNRERGWYQEQLNIEMKSDGTPGISLIAAAPSTTESYSTYSETTGWEVGVDSGGEFGLSYGQSQTSSTTFGNFRVDYTGPGNTARWRYSMDSTGGSAQYPYDEPFDLIFEHLLDCGFGTCLREVNEKAVSTIGLTAEAVWRADLDFDETVGFHMWHSQALKFIRYDRTECPFFCYDYYEQFADSSSQGFRLDVDFSQVHPYGPDADSDGIPDYMEGIDDLDGDGSNNSEDLDADGDGLADAQEWIDDPDDDLKPNYLDTDSDNDNFLDSQELAAGTDPYSALSRPDIAMANLALGRASTGGGTVVSLPPALVDPIVIVGPPSNTDPAPGVLRISEVTPTQFSADFQEWPSEDGNHGSEDFSWLAIEPGRYATTYGSIWEAGRTDVIGSASWTQVNFTAPLPDVPIVLVSIQTNTAGQALAARVRNVSTDGFEVAMFTEEASAPVTATETVAYFVVNSPSGSDGVVIDGETVPTLVQQFAADHRETPLLSSFIRIAEEASADSETEHGLEAIAAFALGTEIFVQDQSAADLDPMSIRWDPPRYGAGFEVGLVRGVRRAPGLTVPYSRSFSEPIVVAYPDDPSDNVEGVVRVKPVHRTANLQRFQTEGGFGIHFQLFPNDTPNWFDECYNFPDPPRDIRYVVAESGSGQVGGLQWEAGSIYTDRYAGLDQWEPIFFQAGFTESPSVFSDAQNERCGDILGGAHSNVSATGLDVSIDYLSQDCAYCTLQYDPDELWYEVGWMAIQSGVGATVDDRLIRVTADTIEIAYGETAPEPATARFTWSPLNPQPGEPVQFTDTSTGVVSQWSWNFGDGGSSTEQNPVHIFDGSGTFVVLQAVSGNLGVDTTTSAVVVGGASPVIFSDNFETGGAGSWSTVVD
jgi:hypothetical protein